jgi:DNA-binding NarL/FixJ family response regulator
MSTTARARGLSTVGVHTPHDLIATALRSMLTGQPGLAVLPRSSDTAPDLLLYDVIGLVGGDTGELDEWLARPSTTVVALGRLLRPDLVALARERGVGSAVPLSASTEEFRCAVRDALAGRLEALTASADSAGLSPRETDVLRLVMQGLGNQEIADELYLSINSVKTYIRSAYRKMDVTTRSQAVAWCLRHGFPPRAA